MPRLEGCLPPGVAPPSPPFLYKASWAPPTESLDISFGSFGSSVDHIPRLLSLLSGLLLLLLLQVASVFNSVQP